jgi:shikimate kinase
MVVSLGGGAIIRDENRSAIRALGLTVWLQASPETLHKRICDDVATAAQRPKLSKLGDLEEIRTILARREAWYDEVADLRISTESLTLDEVTAQIAAWFRGHT